jgi:hypothetical protein
MQGVARWAPSSGKLKLLWVAMSVVDGRNVRAL